MWRISIWNDLGHFRLRGAAAPERSVLAGRLGEIPPVCGGYPPAAGSPEA